MLTRKQISEKLIATGKSERLLAEETGFSTVSIGRLRRGEGNPNRSTLISISNYLKGESHED